MFTDGLLAGKRILVTGGGTGLGREIAERYLALGAEVWIAGRRGAVLDATADELMARHGGVVRTHAVDIRDAQAVDAMVERIWTEAGPLTGLVNNAAGNFYYPSHKLSDNQWKAVLEIDLYGTFFCCRAAQKHLAKQGGAIISTSMTLHYQGWVGMVPACSAKAGIDALWCGERNGRRAVSAP